MSNYPKFPLIPLRGKVAFPNVNISFEVGRAKTLKAIKHASDIYVANAGDITLNIPYTIVNNKDDFLSKIEPQT